MVLSILRIKVLPGKQKDAVEILRSVEEDLAGKRECSGSWTYRSEADQDSILYLEGWTKREALHRHIRSVQYDRILNVMELAVEPPDIQFHECEETKGIELIFELRNGGKIEI